MKRKFKWDILSDFQTLCIKQIQNMKTKEIILRLFFVADVAHMQNLKCKKKSAFIFESRRSRRRFWYFLHANLGGSFFPHPLGRDCVNSWKNVLKNIFFTRVVKFLLRQTKKWTWPRALKSPGRKSLYDPLYSRLIYRLSELRKVFKKQEFLTCDENNDDNDNGKTDYLR